ncbi:nucleotide-binding protein [Xanthomonas campestris pv. campestris]|uniref:TIR domain-containing protein n=1 Tax=Xanthomonas campestris TaxID=339 RepID=UPI002AD4F79A|nr:TIR domain-containing protein [Xanthomonas campestris]MEA0735678.1 nucleotide-binding protein [Xanthomonas campestris pv. campestris]
MSDKSRSSASMIERFAGPEGKRRLIPALAKQKLVGANAALAAALADLVELREFAPDEVLISAGGSDNQLFLLLSGTVDITVKGTKVAERTANDVVGEMAAVDPSMPRSATVTATCPVATAVVTEPQLSEVGDRFPDVFRHLAVLMAQKLEQRNSLVRATSDRIRIFLISSGEAVDIARAVHTALSYDEFDVIPWNEGVFRATSYTLKTLEDEIDRCDFAVAIAHGDDAVESRSQTWPAPRDNVIFEVGLFMGRLGVDRAILMEPRDEKVKLPSDIAGVTTITYRYDPKDRDRAAKLAPSCNRLRDYILEKGPRKY